MSYMGEGEEEEEKITLPDQTYGRPGHIIDKERLW
jgi:hypothetical protein